MATPIHILAVDDEPDVELLLTQKFRGQIRNCEFAFEFAANGALALDRIRTAPAPDVVLLDINMPVMDGLTMLARLAEIDVDLRVIVVSAYGDMTNLRTAMNRGAFDFVTKPVDMADLEATIRKSAAEIDRYRALKAQREASERRQRNLARYFSPALADYLAARDDPLGPARRQQVAVLFADLVGFVGISDASTPEEVIELLREFHGCMSAVIFAHGGVVEKYIGDAVCATFGVPDSTGEEAAAALRCAVAMLEKLRLWSTERTSRGQCMLQMGVGLNYGPAVLGDIGAQHSMSFSVVGATVNVASRLQSHTRSAGTALLASDALVSAARASSPDDRDVATLLPDHETAVIRGTGTTMGVWCDRARFPMAVHADKGSP